MAEQQANELASGLPHDKYLFASGALTALRRIYTLTDDILAAAATLKELDDDRTEHERRSAERASTRFLNTPWYDGWRANTASPNERPEG